MKRILLVVLCGLTLNVHAQSRRGGDDSTGLSLSFIGAATQTRGVDQARMRGQSINIPTREIVYNQPIYINNPPPPPTTVQCTTYTSDHIGWRFATSEEVLSWGTYIYTRAKYPSMNCPGFPTYPVLPMPVATMRNIRDYPNPNNTCATDSFLVPVYQNVCTG